MKITFLVWLLFIVCIALPSCKSESQSYLDQEKQVKYGHGIMSIESSRQDHQQIKSVHIHSSTSRRAKGVYGGANDNRTPRTGKSGSSPTLSRPNLFLAATLGHLAIGFFIFVLFP